MHDGRSNSCTISRVDRATRPSERQTPQEPRRSPIGAHRHCLSSCEEAEAIPVVLRSGTFPAPSGSVAGSGLAESSSAQRNR